MLPRRSHSCTCIYPSFDRTRLGLSTPPYHVQYLWLLPRRSRLGQLRTRAGSSLPHSTLTSIHTFITNHQVYERLITGLEYLCGKLPMILSHNSNAITYPDEHHPISGLYLSIADSCLKLVPPSASSITLVINIYI